MSLWQLAANGGWMMYPIYACSFVALVVSIQKLVHLRSKRLTKFDWLEPALDSVEAGDYEFARTLCAKQANPAAAVVAGMIGALERRPELVEAEARRVGAEELDGLEKRLGLLATIAEVAPLLGLLGTVVGMVDMFMGMQSAAMTGAIATSSLASGIWKALLTTAAGLAVAMPALAMHAYLSSRIDAFRSQLGSVIARVQFIAPEQQPAASREIFKLAAE
jgi:biopolymer transport protein ExbB